MSELLLLEGVTAGYGDAVVLEDITLALGTGGSVAVLGPKRRRQDDAVAHHHGIHPADARAT